MKCFCNLMAYSKKIKKITIKRTMIKCEGKINCKGWFDFSKGLM